MGGPVHKSQYLFDSILGSKVQPIKARLMIQMKVTLTDQMSKKGKISQKLSKGDQLAISQMFFHTQTSYLVPRYNPIRRFHEPGDGDLDLQKK